MKVLLLSPLPPPTGGIASWTVRYRDYCAKEKIDLEIVDTSVTGKRAKKETTKRSLPDEIQRTLHIMRMLREGLKRKPDVVHINTACSPFGVIRDAICAYLVYGKAPLIIHCRCNIRDQLGSSRLSIGAFESMVKMASRVIVLNQDSKEYIDRICKDKAIYIPNFIEEAKVRDSHVIREAIKKALYVGHIERAKGIDVIQAAAELNPQVEFVLVGAVRESLEHFAFPTNVTIEGPVTSEEVDRYLREADVFVFPSKSEGFSNALLEAMASGLPVIASDVGANKEMISDLGGIILAENTGESVSDALMEMKDLRVRVRMSKWNIAKVKRDYTIGSVMTELMNLYMSVQ